jgi:hypothetical protein
VNATPPTEPCLPQHYTYLERLRGNAQQALWDGANLVDLTLAMVLVTRGRARPTEVDINDAAVLAEQLASLNDMRKPIGGDR